MAKRTSIPPTLRAPVIALLVAMLSFPASAEWKEKVLYSFQGGTDGFNPVGAVARDKLGNLYGVNNGGGTSCPSPGCGTVFELSPPSQKGGAWTETTIYGFKGINGGETDGATPVGGIVIDSDGNLYGTTAYGGNGSCKLLGSTTGCGIVYELSPPVRKGAPWSYAILCDFQGGNDGQFPWGDVAFDSKGNLYGSTQFGGGKGTGCDSFYGYCGTAFELRHPKKNGGQWVEKILHSFAGGSDGANPNGALIFDSKGAIYGTTLTGGNQGCQEQGYGAGCGTVFRLSPPSKSGTRSEDVLHRFDGGDGGNDGGPSNGLLLGNLGELYGTTRNRNGTIFMLSPPAKNRDRWLKTNLHNFSNCDTGCSPEVTLGPDAKLYGTGSVGAYRSGVIFRLARRQGSSWQYSDVYDFRGAPDGFGPAFPPAFSKDGKLFGATKFGGTGQCQGGCGTVFELSP
jgi:hypothetical protein